jgi:lysine 2,3-aminomutase
VTPALRQVADQFGVALTPTLMEMIDPTDPHDPIAAQFLPNVGELTIHPDELGDPISDHPFTPVKGVVHRYPDRALLKLLLACPAYCRFCFRRDMLGKESGTLMGEELDRALNYIETHPEIWEVILTGGDPLMLGDNHLAGIVRRLNAIPHVKIIRVHTRVPVVEPSRVTPGLVKALNGRAPVYVLLHCNHPRELTETARAACARLINAGIPMLSQTVLLRGVNNNVETLEALMRAFLESRIKPYYLHHADLARGTGHFRVPLEKGRALVRGLRGHLSGLAQPTYVLDIPGGHGKVPVGPDYLSQAEDGWSVEDFRGGKHVYREKRG